MAWLTISFLELHSRLCSDGSLPTTSTADDPRKPIYHDDSINRCLCRTTVFGMSVRPLCMHEAPTQDEAGGHGSRLDSRDGEARYPVMLSTQHTTGTTGQTRFRENVVQGTRHTHAPPASHMYGNTQAEPGVLYLRRCIRGLFHLSLKKLIVQLIVPIVPIDCPDCPD